MGFRTCDRKTHLLCMGAHSLPLSSSPEVVQEPRRAHVRTQQSQASAFSFSGMLHDELLRRPIPSSR